MNSSNEEDEIRSTLSFSSDREIMKNGEMSTVRRVRREIANSNERRRMQSINTGFQYLKTMLPIKNPTSLEKMSKAGVLQQAAEYIFSLEQDKTKLLHQVCSLKRFVFDHISTADGSPIPGKRLRLSEDAEVDQSHLALQQEIIELRCQLDRERKQRMTHMSRESPSPDNLVTENQRLASLVADLQARLAATPESTVTPGGEMGTKHGSHCPEGLQTIVEAIKHVEGRRFSEDCLPTSSKRARP